MGKNIFEIWKENGEKLLFAVRRDDWAAKYCAVVEEIEIKKWPYGIARGYSTKNGYPNRHFAYDPNWIKDRQIPNAGSYQWTPVPDFIPLQGSKNLILNLDSFLTFGKYKDFTLANVYNIDPSYILWIILNIKNVVIEPAVLNDWSNIDSSRLCADVLAFNCSKYQKFIH